MKASNTIKKFLSAVGVGLLVAMQPTAYGSACAQGVTVKNPMLWADVPDPDVIRVGDTFYLVSTTMHLMPGAPIMASKDFKHWTTISYIFDKLTDSPKYNMENGTSVYGRGQWATSLKYHKGKFYALFAPNDNPGGETYIMESKDAVKWDLVSRLPHFHDASLFFDDDNRVYVFYGNGSIIELNEDLKSVKQGGLNKLLFQRDAEETGLLEGSRMIKKDGKYCLLMISWPAGKPRRQLCYRSDSLTGSWEKKVILESQYGGFPYVGQGTIVDGPNGEWYGVIFQDRGGVGRVLTLNPCQWKDGWPMLGDENGKVPATLSLNLPEGKGLVQSVVGNEEFDESEHPNELFLHNWEWNHNPVDEAWSLSDRKGWLRLKTSQISSNGLFSARNTISQRMEGPACSGIVKLDISHMQNGDRAGFAVFQNEAGLLQIRKDNNKCYLEVVYDTLALSRDKNIEKSFSSVLSSSKLKAKIVYLKIEADFHPGKDIARGFYSLDGKKWTRIGTDFSMKYDYRRMFMGSRFAIYNYATQAKGGWIDVDYFHYTKEE